MWNEGRSCDSATSLGFLETHRSIMVKSRRIGLGAGMHVLRSGLRASHNILDG